MLQKLLCICFSVLVGVVLAKLDHLYGITKLGEAIRNWTFVAHLILKSLFVYDLYKVEHKEDFYQQSRFFIKHTIFKEHVIENDREKFPDNCFIIANHPTMTFDILGNAFFPSRVQYVLRTKYGMPTLFEKVYNTCKKILYKHRMIIELPKKGGFDSLKNNIEHQLKNKQNCRIFLFPEGRRSDVFYKLNQPLRSTVFKLAHLYKFPIIIFMVDPFGHFCFNFGPKLRHKYLPDVDPRKFANWQDLQEFCKNQMNEQLGIWQQEYDS